MKKFETPLSLIIDGYNWSTSYSPQHEGEALQVVLFSGATGILSKTVIINDQEAKQNNYSDSYYDSVAVATAQQLILSIDQQSSQQS